MLNRLYKFLIVAWWVSFAVSVDVFKSNQPNDNFYTYIWKDIWLGQLISWPQGSYSICTRKKCISYEKSSSRYWAKGNYFWILPKLLFCPIIKRISILIYCCYVLELLQKISPEHFMVFKIIFFRVINQVKLESWGPIANKLSAFWSLLAKVSFYWCIAKEVWPW